MEQESNRPNPGMVGCDRDLFARVWARVEPHPGESCPIEVLPPIPPQPRKGGPPSAVRTPSAPLPAPVDFPGEDGPQPGDVPCLGREGADHARFLQQGIRTKLETWRRYQALSAHGGAAGRTLASIGAAERRNARRLSGAYFLISGIRFLPDAPQIRFQKGAFWGGLREMFWQEQQASALYAAAAEETADPCLAQLYRELSAEDAAHADLLRALTEQM